jgi:hypothetical protein
VPAIAAALAAKEAAPRTADETAQHDAHLKRVAEAKAEANLARATERAAATAATGIPRDAQTTLTAPIFKKWANNPDLGGLAWLDRSSTAADTAKSGHGRCSLPGCLRAGWFALTLDALRSHAGSMTHKSSLAAASSTATGAHEASLESAVFVASASSSAAASLKQQQSTVRRYAVGSWVASGMVLEALDSAVRPLRSAMAICEDLGSSTHAGTELIPAVFDELRADLVKVVSRTPSLTLVIDGGDAKFGDGHTGNMGVYDVYAESGYWLEPLLLETLIVRKDPGKGGSTGVEIAKMLTDVMEAYSLTVFDSGDPSAGSVIGVATDNASVMKKAARHAKLPRIACGSHVGNLIVGNILDELQLPPLLDLLNSVFSPAAGLDDLAARAGFTAGSLRTADYKFAHGVGGAFVLQAHAHGEPAAHAPAGQERAPAALHPVPQVRGRGEAGGCSRRVQ